MEERERERCGKQTKARRMGRKTKQDEGGSLYRTAGECVGLARINPRLKR